MENLKLHFVKSIEEIGQNPWNGVVGIENPFTRYEFLHGLEQTGCTNEKSGWAPYHVAIYDAGGKEPNESSQNPLICVVPLYLKNNSWGEYVFDWSWANAYQSHGLEYYPKLVTSAPFTPSSGKRFFVSEQFANKIGELLEFVTTRIKDEAKRLGASSWHILFPTESENALLGGLGIQSRVGTQFHWYNRNFESFDDFLSVLNSRKRKSIRKERKKVADQGITFTRTEGAEISDQQWEDFYLFYQSTYLMRGQQGYLSKDFFRSIGESMPEQILLINAIQEERSIAAALFFKNQDSLFGRYWGSAADYQFLHFETCYYQGQEYAIEKGIGSFDSGAQGEHKIQRGFEPIITHSNHWVAHPAFADAIKKFLNEERPHIESYRKSAEALLPFKIEESSSKE
ncbi:MAG TPA: GNAT family N-acetyltransferase [Gammaproteobacteria bacterium]|nr:GNAT family N-acetyltransferase [Gammaproteobacteria bacterium]